MWSLEYLSSAPIKAKELKKRKAFCVSSATGEYDLFHALQFRTSRQVPTCAREREGCLLRKFRGETQRETASPGAGGYCLITPEHFVVSLVG